MEQAYFSIPVELMEILNRINNNISEVKERITRIEAQDHSDSIKSVRIALEAERVARTKLELEVSNMKTRLAPVLFAATVLAAAAIEFIFNRFHLIAN